jgi:transposase-like protein
MSPLQLVLPSSFCHNPDCPDYGKADQGNVRKFGFTRKGIQRYQCKTCCTTFTEFKDTVLHGRHHSLDTIVECLKLLAERSSLAAIHRVKGIKEETVMDWLEQAVGQVEVIEQLLLRDYHFTRAQMDALWTYVGHKGKKGDMRKNKNVAAFGGVQP